MSVGIHQSQESRTSNKEHSFGLAREAGVFFPHLSETYESFHSRLARKTSWHKERIEHLDVYSRKHSFYHYSVDTNAKTIKLIKSGFKSAFFFENGSLSEDVEGHLKTEPFLDEEYDFY